MEMDEFALNMKIVTLLYVLDPKWEKEPSIYRRTRWKNEKNGGMWDHSTSNGQVPLVKMWMEEGWAHFNECANKWY